MISYLIDGPLEKADLPQLVSEAVNKAIKEKVVSNKILACSCIEVKAGNSLSIEYQTPDYLVLKAVVTMEESNDKS